MSKLISIIIATYNAGKTLNRCLSSISSQLNDNCELLIIDGGSKDNTLEIIKSYGNKVTCLISEPDKGIYDAWNKGVMLASGDWLMFVGADDELLPGSIKTYLKYILNTTAIEAYDYICAQNDYVDYKGKLIKKIGKEPSWENMRKYMAAAHVGSLHNKKSLFDEVGLYSLDYHICADYELLLRKKSNLTYKFLVGKTIARMQEGGMSMSRAAVIETFKIRKAHHTIPAIFNVIILLKSLLAFRFYNYHR